MILLVTFMQSINTYTHLNLVATWLFQFLFLEQHDTGPSLTTAAKINSRTILLY